jgi:hypothetical protein
VHAIRVKDASELPAKMKEFLEYDGAKPVLMECVVETNEHVYPMVRPPPRLLLFPLCCSRPVCRCPQGRRCTSRCCTRPSGRRKNPHEPFRSDDSVLFGTLILTLAYSPHAHKSSIALHVYATRTSIRRSFLRAFHRCLCRCCRCCRTVLRETVESSVQITGSCASRVVPYVRLPPVRLVKSHDQGFVSHLNALNCP